MRAETVKRMILLSIPDPPEDLEELVELYARLWSQEGTGGPSGRRRKARKAYRKARKAYRKARSV